jgi:MoaA/NifB/PqqE/SkfB family radical SAM enzyme
LIKCNNLDIYSLVENTVKKNKFSTRCYAGDIDAVLYANGEVFPCEILPDRIGNIRDFSYDFEKLWSSKKAKIIRKKIKGTCCFCTHECFLVTANLFNIRRLLPLLTRTLFYSAKRKK